MKIAQAIRLEPESVVFWKDPDNGECSKYILVKSITHKGEGFISLTGQNGDDLECFARELTYIPVEVECLNRAKVLQKYTDYTLEEIIEFAPAETTDTFWLSGEEAYQVLTKEEIEALGLDPYHSSIWHDNHYWIRTIK